MNPESGKIDIYDLSLCRQTLQRNNILCPDGRLRFYYQKFEQLPIEIQTAMIEKYGESNRDHFRWQDVEFIHAPDCAVGFGFPSESPAISALNNIGFKPSVKTKVTQAIQGIRQRIFGRGRRGRPR